MNKKTKKIEPKLPPKEKHFMNTEKTTKDVLEEWSQDNDWIVKRKKKKC